MQQQAAYFRYYKNGSLKSVFVRHLIDDPYFLEEAKIVPYESEEGSGLSGDVHPQEGEGVYLVAYKQSGDRKLMYTCWCLKHLENQVYRPDLYEHFTVLKYGTQRDMNEMARAENAKNAGDLGILGYLLATPAGVISFLVWALSWGNNNKK
jgi:hypothetical protein